MDKGSFKWTGTSAGHQGTGFDLELVSSNTDWRNFPGEFSKADLEIRPRTCPAMLHTNDDLPAPTGLNSTMFATLCGSGGF